MKIGIIVAMDKEYAQQQPRQRSGRRQLRTDLGRV